MKIIKIALNDPYKIFFGSEVLANFSFSKFCAKLGNTVVIIADSKVARLYSSFLLAGFKQQKIKTHFLTFMAKEENKSREMKEKLENKMLSLGCGKDTCIVALGGGITTDLAGFVAATYCRGIPVCYIPTTLLAMADASIGGKTGVNTSYGKNLIGIFAQPRAIFMDTTTLKTLTPSEFKNGIVEIIKCALIRNKQYFHFLSKNSNKILQQNHSNLRKTITEACNIKKYIIEQDEKDKDMRQILNFGHTIGHALEKTTEYKISHGVAVALGIIVESFISVQLGFLSEENFKGIKEIFRRYQIPLTLPYNCNKYAIKKALLFDKKAIEQHPYFVLLDDIGQVHVSPKTGYTMPVPEKIIDVSLRVICSI
jgi:3-dehydroquinate synthase